MNIIRIMLIDDHVLVREGLKALLDGQADMKVVAEAGTIPTALSLLSDRNPDIIVLDLNLPGGGSLSFAEKSSANGNGPKVIILSMHDEPAYVRAALGAGAKGYIVKTIRHNDLLAAIRSVNNGQVVLNLDDETKTAALFGKLGPSTGGPFNTKGQKLSEREYAVLRLLGLGHSNQEIAETLELSPKTVATYRARISEKLGLKTTSEYVKYVTDHGIAGSPENLV